RFTLEPDQRLRSVCVAYKCLSNYVVRERGESDRAAVEGEVMAKILGGFAVSHTPTIAFAKDANKQSDPVWAPIFEGFEPVKQWLADEKPDVILYVYNDHMTSFFTH